MAPPRAWVCRGCGFTHKPAHTTCTWCDAAPRKTTRASVSSAPVADAWIDYSGRRPQLPRPPVQQRRRVAPVASTAAATSTWTEVVARKTRVAFTPAADVASGAPAVLRIWKNNAWAALSDGDDDGEGDEPVDAQAADAAAKEEQRVARATALAGLADMRRHLAQSSQTEFHALELAAVDERIRALEHECHGAKPIGQQQKALSSRLARAQASLAQFVDDCEEARVASVAAGQAYVDSNARVATQEAAVDEIVAALGAITAKIETQAAAAAPPTCMEVDGRDSLPCLADSCGWSLESQHAAVAALARFGWAIGPTALDANAWPPRAAASPLRALISTPVKRRSRGRSGSGDLRVQASPSDAPVAARASVVAVDESPPPTVSAAYGKAGTRSACIARAEPYGGTVPGAPVAASEDGPVDDVLASHFRQGAELLGKSR